MRQRRGTETLLTVVELDAVLAVTVVKDNATNAADPISDTVDVLQQLAVRERNLHCLDACTHGYGPRMTLVGVLVVVLLVVMIVYFVRRT